MTKDKQWKVTFRDKAVNKVCNWIITTFASKEYAAFIQVTTSKGLEQVDKMVEGWANDKR